MEYCVICSREIDEDDLDNCPSNCSCGEGIFCSMNCKLIHVEGCDYEDESPFLEDEKYLDQFWY